MSKQEPPPEWDGGSRPVPDPTSLTTQQLYRETAAVEKLLLVEIRALSDRLETRLNAMDKAIELIQKAADRVPSDVDLKVGSLKELVGQRFEQINVQFSERDKAIDAALQAQKESAAKDDERARDELKTLSALVDTKTEGLRGRLDTIQSFQSRLGLGA